MKKRVTKKPNVLFPGKPHYVGPKKGFFLLLHHELLVEYSHNVKERIEYIKTEKAPHEQSTRLRHIVRVLRVPKVLSAKMAAADRACYKFGLRQSSKGYAAAYTALCKKRNVVSQAIASWRVDNEQTLTHYLKKHVRNCRWNGSELVF